MLNAVGFAEQTPVKFEFFGYRLTVPSGHLLRSWFDPKSRLYEPYRESGLIKLAQALSERSGTAIDIGANVGDTCAILHRYSRLNILSIEASDFFFPYLQENVERCFSGRATARQAFVLPNDAATAKALYHWGATAKPVDGMRTENCETVAVADLIASAGEVALFKTDTDGLDIELISAVLGCGRRFPIYFEYEFAGDNQEHITEHAKRFQRLLMDAANVGYYSAFAWDAPGRFYGLLDLKHPRTALNAVNYLGHNKHQSVWGYDICLIHQTDADAANRLCELISRDTLLPVAVNWAI